MPIVLEDSSSLESIITVRPPMVRKAKGCVDTRLGPTNATNPSLYGIKAYIYLNVYIETLQK